MKDRKELLQLCSRYGISIENGLVLVDREMVEASEVNLIKALMKKRCEDIDEISLAECYTEVFKRNGIITSFEFTEGEEGIPVMLLKMADGETGFTMAGLFYLMDFTNEISFTGYINLIEHFMTHNLERFLEAKKELDAKLQKAKEETFVWNRKKMLLLREQSGAGMKDCMKALTEAGGDIDIAYEYLKLLSQPVVRKIMVKGEFRPWQDEDYLAEARKVVREEYDKKEV